MASIWTSSIQYDFIFILKKKTIYLVQIYSTKIKYSLANQLFSALVILRLGCNT